MKIVHLITTLGVGGAEKHLVLLGRGQQQRGHDVQVVYLKGEGELAGDFTRAGMTVTKLAFERPRDLGAALKGLRQLLSAAAPDVLHTHLLKADALGALVARKSGVPVVVSSKHNDERALLRWPVGIIHGRLMRRVDRIIALSDHVAAFTARHGRVPRDAIERIYYGVDPEALVNQRDRASMRAELGLADDNLVLVCVGRLAPQKDHPTLLRAMVHLPDVSLLVVGGDPFGSGELRLRELTDELGLAGRVRLLGIRRDVPDLLAASDLFVLPSLWEGLGLVFLEAMAVRLPIVASNVSAIPEVVDDGVSGWLVEPGDPGALAAVLLAALGDPDGRAARGLAGHMRLLERFALPRMIDETLAVYAAVRRAKGLGPEE